MSIAVITLLLCASPAKSAGERPKLIVLEAAVAGGIDPQVAGPFTEALTTEIASRGFFDVVSSRDVQTLLGVERQRQLLGCSEQGSCMTELAGALGAQPCPPIAPGLAELGLARARGLDGRRRRGGPLLELVHLLARHRARVG